MKPEIRVFVSPDDIGLAAANLFYDVASQAIESRSAAHIVLSGGSTPVPMYQQIREDPNLQQFPWDKVHIYWGDERCVPPNHEDSNFRLAKEELLDYLEIPVENIHRMKGEIEPERSASEYQDKLKAIFPSTPKFDLVYLGIGEDGHTASIFPNETYSTDPNTWVQAIYVEKLKADRLTMTPKLINQAGAIAFLAAGARKANIIADLFGDSPPKNKYPVQQISPAEGELICMLDKDAASLL